jgi:hypothetical protein
MELSEAPILPKRTATMGGSLTMQVLMLAVVVILGMASISMMPHDRVLMVIGGHDGIHFSY